MKKSFISLVLAVILLLTFSVGCGGKSKNSKPDESSASISMDSETVISDNLSEISLDETSNGTSEVSDVSSGKSKAPGTSKTSTTGSSKTVNTSGNRWGVTNTKKMPNFLSKINNKTLKVVTSSEGIDDAADRLAFKALTGIDIKIDYEVVVWATLPERVAGMVMSGSSPDMFSYTGSMWLNLLKQPYWDDWTKYIDFEDALWKETKSINNGLGDYDGKRVGLFYPSTNSAGGSIIYNTKLVQEAIDNNSKLDDPLKMYYNDKWTWDTLYTFVEEITDLDGGIYGISLPDYAVSKFIASTGEDIIKVSADKNLKYNLESTNVIRALDFAKKFYKISNVAATWEGASMLLNNTCGFWDNSSGLQALYSSDAMINAVKAGKIKAVPFPRDPKSNTYYIGGVGNSYVLPLDAKNPWLTAAWIYYLRYKSYNPNQSVVEAARKKYMDEYGWSEDIYALTDKKAYTNKFSKLKYTVSPACIAYGERLSDFDQGEYWSMITNPSVLTSTVIETVGPGLKEVINRFNAK